jgi:pimeloyl-ACP methyl ester carboxylesterase
MRGVLVKAVNETARGAYLPLLRAWASEGKPVELVWGEHDDQASLAALRPVVDDLPSVTVTVVPGAGHLITPAAAAQVRAAVLRHQPGGGA